MKRWHFHFIDLGRDAAQAVSKGAGRGGNAAQVHVHGRVLGPPRGLIAGKPGHDKSLRGLHTQIKKRNKITVEKQT